ncbi:MOCS2B [Mytilus coruscus]|uniref:MOCS2B n=1 Tax=Mytilus coruscus TaxID=42192 RepID=A0A6J8BFE0_MYTCO|nr:MOCS2B [Mytilus coruscus]
MTVNILFFAKSRELSGINSAQITVLSQCSFTHLLENILQQYPSLSVISENIILALNEDYLSKDSDWRVIKMANHVEIRENKLDLEKITSNVTSPSCGAVSVFIGTTRDNFDGKRFVNRLETNGKWKKLAMEHRIGLVPVTEASIIIAISSPHRKESLDAVQYAIDTVKAIVPVWKKEIYEDESSQWKENKECYWKSS